MAGALRAGALPEARFRDALDRARLDDELDLPLGLRALRRVLVATGGFPSRCCWRIDHKSNIS